MKKVKGEMRAEYKRADFTSLERGKFYKEAVKGAAVALLDPAIAKAEFGAKPCNSQQFSPMLMKAAFPGLVLPPRGRPARTASR